MKKRKPMTGLIRFRRREPGKTPKYNLGDRCKCRRGVISWKTFHDGLDYKVCRECGRNYGRV